MLNKEKLKGFVSGFTVAILFFVFTMSVFASSTRKSIEVIYSNIKLVVDGKNVQFGKDAAGNKIEPFIYNGTTYLPIRSVGEAMGKNLDWDGQTQTVYIGLTPGELNYMTEIIDPYQSRYTDIFKLNDAKTISMGGKSYNSGYRMGGFSDKYMIFNLDGQYTEITGILGAVDWKSITGNRKFNIYLDGKLYQTIEVINDELPKEITIPVSGVMQLKLESPYSGGSTGDTYIGFVDVKIK